MEKIKLLEFLKKYLPINQSSIFYSEKVNFSYIDSWNIFDIHKFILYLILEYFILFDNKILINIDMCANILSCV